MFPQRRLLWGCDAPDQKAAGCLLGLPAELAAGDSASFSSREYWEKGTAPLVFWLISFLVLRRKVAEVTRVAGTWCVSAHGWAALRLPRQIQMHCPGSELAWLP